MLRENIVNPYKTYGRAMLKISSGQDSSEQRICTTQQQTTQVQNSSTMGIQSQKRNGAIYKAKKRGTRAKYKAIPHAGNIAAGSFVSQRDCKRCVYNLRKISNPTITSYKKAHHKLCRFNRKTGGQELNRSNFRLNFVENGVPISEAIFEKPRPQSTITQFFCPPVAERQPPPASEPTSAATSRPSFGSFFKVKHDLANPLILSNELARRVEEAKTTKNFDWVKNQDYPRGIGLMADYICDLFAAKKPTNTSDPLPALNFGPSSFVEAHKKYRHFFKEGSCEFVFPRHVGGSDPEYTALEGRTFIHLDWRLIHPTQALLCYHCKGNGIASHLVHLRTNFSKDRSLFPIWTGSGVPTWCCVMKYKCKTCQTQYAANDGRLLSLLPPCIREIYPVAPRYATGAFHFNEALTDNLEDLMVTYASANYVSKQLYRRLDTEYERKVRTYFSKSPCLPFLSYEEFTANFFPPNAPAIRRLYEDAEYSNLTDYGYSNFERYKREMQSVRVEENEKIAFDWTFQSIKNYNLPGAKAIFTGNKRGYKFGHCRFDSSVTSVPPARQVSTRRFVHRYLSP